MRMTEEQYLAYMTSYWLQIEPQKPARQYVIPKRPKYLNCKTTDLQGVVHDAKGEWQRHEALKLMERAGEIRNLRRQVVYALVVNGLLITTYKADFVYEDGAATIVEDRKSPRTRKLESFRHKVKLMQALHGIQVREV